MKKLIVLFCVLLSVVNIHAQVDSLDAVKAPNAVYFELYGTALFFSFNFETLLAEKYALRAGVGPGFGAWNNDMTTIIPVALTRLLQLHKGTYLELGAGTAFHFYEYEQDIFYGPVIGLRGQNLLDGGIMGRLCFTPLFGPGIEDEEHFAVGFSLGYSF